MNSIISCKMNKLGGHSFYIKHDGIEYYLFSQDYHKGVNNLFSKGVSINNAFNYKTAKRDYCIVKTMSKIRPYIQYIEKEYDVKILKNTINKGVIDKKKKMENQKLDYSYIY